MQQIRVIGGPLNPEREFNTNSNIPQVWRSPVALFRNSLVTGNFSLEFYYSCMHTKLLVFFRNRKGSDATDPLHPLPTEYEGMGNRITLKGNLGGN